MLDRLYRPGWDEIITIRHFSTHIKSLTGLKNKIKQSLKLWKSCYSLYSQTMASVILLFLSITFTT